MSWFLAIVSHPAVLVGVGGALGSNARYWLGKLVREFAGQSTFPWATMLINLSGSLLLGVIAGAFKDRASPAYLLLGTGLCGGFTTFSTFSLEVAESLRDGRWMQAGLYIGASVIGGMTGFLLAYLSFGRAT